MSLFQTAVFAVRTSRLGRVARWAPPSVQQVARNRLRRLLRIAASNSPFYREKLRGIDLDRAELTSLPVSTKEELRSEFGRALTDRRIHRSAIEDFIADPKNLGHWYLGQYAVSRTSGSQGPPMLLVQNRRSIEVLFSIMSARANAGARPSILEGWHRLREPARVAIVAHQRGFYPSAAAFEFMHEIMGRFARIEWLLSTQEDLVSRLNEFQPNTLVGYASVLEGLALKVRDSNKTLPIGSSR